MKNMMTSISKISLTRITIFFMVIVLLTLISIRLATPIKDGDFYWHISIGKYLVENKTLTPDHSVFSWTDTDHYSAKSNWIFDIFVYKMFEKFGLNIMFLFRYLCFFTIIFICFLYTKKSKIKISPVILLMSGIVFLSSTSAAFIKPEILSMVLFSFLFFVLFLFKRQHSIGQPTYIQFFIPLIFLIWANIHKVHLFAFIAFILFFVGELLNYRLAKVKKDNDNKHYLNKFLYIIFLSFICLLLNPFFFKPFHLETREIRYRNRDQTTFPRNTGYLVQGIVGVGQMFQDMPENHGIKK